MPFERRIHGRAPATQDVAGPRVAVHVGEVEAIEQCAHRLHVSRLHRDVVGIAVHERHVAPVEHDLQRVAREQGAAIARAIAPMQRGAPVEVAANAQQRDVVGQSQRIAAPELDAIRRPLHPLAIGFVQQDGHAAERIAPFHHRAVEVRVRDDDAVHATAFLQCSDRIVGHQAHAFPHQMAGAGGQQQCALRNGEFAGDSDAEQARILFDSQPETPRQFVVRRPLLAAPSDVLALVFADRAIRRRRRTFGELGAAGLADEAGHGRGLDDVEASVGRRRTGSWTSRPGSMGTSPSRGDCDTGALRLPGYRSLFGYCGGASSSCASRKPSRLRSCRANRSATVWR